MNLRALLDLGTIVHNLTCTKTNTGGVLVGYDQCSLAHDENFATVPNTAAGARTVFWFDFQQVLVKANKTLIINKV